MYNIFNDKNQYKRSKGIVPIKHILDQASEYVKVDVDEGIVAIPSVLINFKLLYFKTEPVIRNVGTKQKPYIYRTEEYHLNGFYDE